MVGRDPNIKIDTAAFENNVARQRELLREGVIVVALEG
jgi:hypothetical protein